MENDMHARPQLNGNTEADFSEAYVALRDAMEAMDHAASMLGDNVLHYRNFQHLGLSRGTSAAVEDQRRIYAALRQARAALGTIASEISDVLLQEENA
jgi:hypothetical protein